MFILKVYLTTGVSVMVACRLLSSFSAIIDQRDVLGDTTSSFWVVLHTAMTSDTRMASESAQ